MEEERHKSILSFLIPLISAQEIAIEQPSHDGVQPLAELPPCLEHAQFPIHSAIGFLHLSGHLRLKGDEKGEQRGEEEGGGRGEDGGIEDLGGEG